jgi:hypothetical protein
MSIHPRQSDPRARPIKDTGAPDILAVLRTVESRGKRESAKRLRATIGQAFRYALATGRADGDPTGAFVGALASPIVRHRAARIKARWVCEQAHRQLREEPGLDHSEGHSWRGRHRQALMTMIAYAFLQHLPLAAASGGKRISDRPPQATLPAMRKAVIIALIRAPPYQCLHRHRQVRRPLTLKCQSSASFGATVLWQRSGRPMRPS